MYKDGPLAASRDNEILSVRLCTITGGLIGKKMGRDLGRKLWRDRILRNEEKGRIDSAVIRIAGRNVGYAIEGYPGSEHLGITLEWM